jgi:hypothetical protein
MQATESQLRGAGKFPAAGFRHFFSLSRTERLEGESLMRAASCPHHWCERVGVDSQPVGRELGRSDPIFMRVGRPPQVDRSSLQC